MLTSQLFMSTCQLFMSTCQKNIIITSCWKSYFYIVLMTLTVIYLSVYYLTSRHHYLTSRHNFLTSRYIITKSRLLRPFCRFFRCYVYLSDKDVDLSDIYVFVLSKIKSTCQIILLLSVWHKMDKNTFLDLFSNKCIS